MAQNRTIGVGNQLPWHVPEEMKIFRTLTKGKVMIMGRKTFESLGGTPLPGRMHIVVTRQNSFQFNHPLVQIAHDFPRALELAQTLSPPYPEEVIVAGGAEIYTQSLPLLNKLYLSVFRKNFEGDAHFPDLTGSGLKLVSEEEHQASVPFVLQVYSVT